MKNKSLLLIACAIPLVDILWEIFYQLGVGFRLDNLIKDYKNLIPLISPEIILNIKHEISHGLNHLVTEQILYTVCLFFLLLTLNVKMRSSLFNLLKHFQMLTPSFMGVSKPEMFLLQLQCILLRSIESKWLYDSFIKPGTILNRLWIPIVILLVSPIEVRFKIYMEKRFHSLSTVYAGLMYAVATVFFPICYLCYLLVFYELEPLNTNSESLNTNFFFTTARFNENGFFQFSNFVSSCIVFDSSEMNAGGHGEHNSLVSGHQHSSTPSMALHRDASDYVIYFNLHKIANRRYYYFVAPFVKNLIFSGYVFLADKLLLKSLCSTEINHICAHLIMEEFLSTVLFRYLLSPFNIYEKAQVYKYDSVIAKLPSKKAIIQAGLRNNIGFHGLLHPSICFQIFNNQTNLFSRLDNILKPED